MYPPNFDRVGVTAGYAEEPKVNRQVPPIGIALDQLEKELHYLREGLQHLNQRLSPAMRPMPATGNAIPECRNGGSPMVGHVESLTQLVRSSSSDVHAMLDCLEI